MNFLAHAYLSFDNPEILIGNLIADMVKGKQIEKYPEDIKKGIYIHRQIDSYTDRHPITIEAAKVFKTTAGRYAGAFLDVSYDHFLAINNNYTPQEGWSCFAENSYQYIEKHADILPAQFCSMFVYMRSENWFYNYKHTWMIERSFDRLKRRASYLSQDAPIFEDFMKYYKEIEDSFNAFFPELKSFVNSIEN